MTDIERACEVVYEEITGECWHKNKKGHRFAAFHCGKCKTDYTEADNPKLATSLDAWRPIWEAMDYKLLHPYFNYLLEISIADMHKRGIPVPAQHYLFFATPLHHLEAALRMLGHDELAEKISCQK
jgi:hypothetical protein